MPRQLHAIFYNTVLHAYAGTVNWRRCLELMKWSHKTQKKIETMISLECRPDFKANAPRRIIDPSEIDLSVFATAMTKTLVQYGSLDDVNDYDADSTDYVDE